MPSKTLKSANEDWQKTDSKTKEQWSFDCSGTCMMKQHTGENGQLMWYDNGYIRDFIASSHQHKRRVTIQHHDAHNDRHIVKENKHAEEQDWQMWDIVMADDESAKCEPGVPGGFNARWGFFTNRPFYIVSAMDKHKFLTLQHPDKAVVMERRSQPW